MRRTAAVIATAAVLSATAAAIGATPAAVRFTSVQVSLRQSRAGITVTDNDFRGALRIGQDQLVCSETATPPGCRVTISLPNGTLDAVTAAAARPGEGAIAVIGGTGAFAGTSGTGTFRNLDRTGTATAVALRLR